MTRALGSLVGQPLQRKLSIGHAEERRVLARIELDCVIFIGHLQALKHARRIAQIKFLCLPWQQPFFDLLREPAGIAGSAEGLAGKHAGSFMIAMAVAGRAKRLVSTSGRKYESREQYRLSISCPCHLLNVSSAVLEYPKSTTWLKR